MPGHKGLYRRTAARPKLVSIIREPRDMADPRDQMGAIARVSFDTIPLLNREEVRLLPPLEAVTREHGRGHRLLAQTSLGELIRPSGKPSSATRAAFASIDSKQLDFALVDAGGRLAAAIEYQSSGHYHDRAFMRDAVKREALRKAGVPFVEIAEDYREEDVRRQIRQILAPESAGPSRN